MLFVAVIFSFVGMVAFFVTLSDRSLLKSILIFVLSGVLIALSVFQYNILQNSLYNETSETRTYELVSLQDDSQVKGKFSGRSFYVYGSLSTEEVYNFYYKTSDGGFQRGKIDANRTVIYEDNNCKPVVLEYEVIEKSNLSEKNQKIILFHLHEKGAGKSYKV